jgi:hypothetical protein
MNTVKQYFNTSQSFRFLGVNIDIVFLCLFAIILIISILIIREIYKNYKYISNLEEEDFNNLIKENEENKYDSVFNFIQTLETLLKFSLRRVAKNYNFSLHYIHFSLIKILSYIQNIFQYFYNWLRDSFVKKSIKNKVYVKHFWSNLKEFKKEMDGTEK